MSEQGIEHCECQAWARIGFKSAEELINPHHPQCPKHRPFDIAEFAGKVADAMKWWGQQEDGIPDDVAGVYDRLRMIEMLKAILPTPTAPASGESGSDRCPMCFNTGVVSRGDNDPFDCPRCTEPEAYPSPAPGGGEQALCGGCNRPLPPPLIWWIPPGGLSKPYCTLQCYLKDGVANRMDTQAAGAMIAQLQHEKEVRLKDSCHLTAEVERLKLALSPSPMGSCCMGCKQREEWLTTAQAELAEARQRVGVLEGANRIMEYGIDLYVVRHCNRSCSLKACQDLRNTLERARTALTPPPGAPT